MKVKTLLVLGAGIDQLFLIKNAKKMGLNVISLDNNPLSPGFIESDHYKVISNRDLNAIYRFIDFYQKTNNKIDGVITMGSDIPDIVAQVAHYIGTPSISIDSAKIAKNKLLMKNIFVKNNIPTPRFEIATSLKDVRQCFKKFNKNIVIKPSDQAGSRGVSLIRRIEDIEYYYLKAKQNTGKEVLVEEFINGPQISTESICINNKIYTPGFADRNYEDTSYFLPQIMENGGWIPSKFKRYKKAIDDLILDASNQIGLNNAIIKGDIVIGQDGPMIIELAARLSGGDFSESLVPLSSGINYIPSAIRLALGAPIDLDELKVKYNQAIANRYFFASPGKLVNISGIDKISNKSWLKKLDIWYKPGDILPEIKTHGNRTGVFIVSASNRSVLEKRIKYVYESINFTVESV